MRIRTPAADLGTGPDGTQWAGFRQSAGRRLEAAGRAIARLTGGLSTAALALAILPLLIVTVLAVPLGVGLLMAPAALRAVHVAADRERRRLDRYGFGIVAPQPPPRRLRPALAYAPTRRELKWLVWHATSGLAWGLVGVWLPIAAVRDSLFPLLWPALPDNPTTTSFGYGTAHTWADTAPVPLLGIGWIAVIVSLAPHMARWQTSPGRRLLSVGPGTDLPLRVAELTATRAAALDAHAAELRRIERMLHDGTQNRIVSVTVLLGAARRMVTRDPAAAEELLERAQSAAEQALAELRAVSRSILPPVLADRGLAGALSGLAAGCSVPCGTEVDVPRRCAASVEASAYFVVAEALTNIARHSGADRAQVTVRVRGERLLLRIEDDGKGGADERLGTGIAGIRHRVAAHDGTLTVSSPQGGPTTLEVDLPCGS
ncbi:sensor histidine kinase [Streptomyces sp. NPDC050523]|uniref:sensor histidine kinase n=1 Tax=Streptomyces sp. NPDC050523 TaxID=3365622 RepID=UPI0037A71429